jgi:hypothetical protein
MVNSAIAFGLAVLASLLWFVAVPLLAPGLALTPVLHIAFLVAPIFMSGLTQFTLTRHKVVSKARRSLQLSVAAFLAPALGAALLSLFWLLGLDRGV